MPKSKPPGIDPTGAPGSAETKITPEMIEAGAKAVREYDRDYESADEAAVRIFSEMAAVAPKPL